jgi:hypothetical protein
MNVFIKSTMTYKVSALSISSTNIQNFRQYLHVCAQLQETPIKLLRKLHGQLARNKCQQMTFLLSFTQFPLEKTTSLAMASHLQFCSHASMHSNNGNFLIKVVGNMRFGV